VFTLSNTNRLEVSITNFGGIVTTIMAPDRNGELTDVVLGFDDLDGYLAGHPYFGAIVGRVANRIADGSFELDGTTHRLARNSHPHHLHGGEVGFDRALWQAHASNRSGLAQLRLEHTSPDGDQGYPGRLDVQATYTLNDDNELRLDYRASTDLTTHINLTNHGYFNLNGPENGDVLGHELTLDADRFTPVNTDLIPTGEIRGVADSPMDFRQPEAIGTRVEADDEQIRIGGGYDHNWVLNTRGDLERVAARVVEPRSGRVLEIRTTEPGVQLYTGNHLTEELIGKGGIRYRSRCAFCLETQHFPDSPNQPDFPSTVIRPGENYESTTIYRFGVES